VCVLHSRHDRQESSQARRYPLLAGAFARWQGLSGSGTAGNAAGRAWPKQQPIISQIVLAAIAFGDSLTAKRAQVINQQDHAAAPRLLRDVLQNTLPETQERRYRRILGFKDEVQYGAKAAQVEEARRLLADLESFAQWAADLL
jgi:hypothetical protein